VSGYQLGHMLEEVENPCIRSRNN